MASSRSNKSKSSGLRILWIPGRRKSHPKGRYDATNKQVAYSSKQKNNEMWSLGGNKAQTDIIKADTGNSALIDTPSVSGIAAIGAASAAVAIKCSTDEITSTNPTIVEKNANDSDTAPPNLLVTQTEDSTQPVANTPTTLAETNSAMPAKTTPAIITTTTTVEIIDENRFSALRPKSNPIDFDIDDLPMPPKDVPQIMNALADRTALVVTAQPKASTSPKLENGEQTGTIKKGSHHRNHNNNHQSDVNSIESISENVNIPSADMDWIDDLMLEGQCKNDKTTKAKRKKAKKNTVKDLDQLDGVPIKRIDERVHEDDEKFVKCLYYTLMCCDCSIS